MTKRIGTIVIGKYGYYCGIIIELDHKQASSMNLSESDVVVLYIGGMLAHTSSQTPAIIVYTKEQFEEQVTIVDETTQFRMCSGNNLHNFVVHNELFSLYMKNLSTQIINVATGDFVYPKNVLDLDNGCSYRLYMNFSEGIEGIDPVSLPIYFSKGISRI